MGVIALLVLPGLFLFFFLRHWREGRASDSSRHHMSTYGLNFTELIVKPSDATVGTMPVPPHNPATSAPSRLVTRVSQTVFTPQDYSTVSSLVCSSPISAPANEEFALPQYNDIVQYKQGRDAQYPDSGRQNRGNYPDNSQQQIRNQYVSRFLAAQRAAEALHSKRPLPRNP